MLLRRRPARAVTAPDETVEGDAAPAATGAAVTAPDETVEGDAAPAATGAAPASPAMKVSAADKGNGIVLVEWTLPPDTYVKSFVVTAHPTLSQHKPDHPNARKCEIASLETGAEYTFSVSTVGLTPELEGESDPLTLATKLPSRLWLAASLTVVGLFAVAGIIFGLVALGANGDTWYSLAIASAVLAVRVPLVVAGRYHFRDLGSNPRSRQTHLDVEDAALLCGPTSSCSSSSTSRAEH